MGLLSGLASRSRMRAPFWRHDVIAYSLCGHFLQPLATATNTDPRSEHMSGLPDTIHDLAWAICMPCLSDLLVGLLPGGPCVRLQLRAEHETKGWSRGSRPSLMPTGTGPTLDGPHCVPCPRLALSCSQTGWGLYPVGLNTALSSSYWRPFWISAPHQKSAQLSHSGPSSQQMTLLPSSQRKQRPSGRTMTNPVNQPDLPHPLLISRFNEYVDHR